MDRKPSEQTEMSTSRVTRAFGHGKRLPNLFEEMLNAANEKEQKKKQDEYFKFIASTYVEFKFCDEIIVKPPAGEEFRMHCMKLNGQESLVISGGIGYEIFPEIWTIKCPQKPQLERFESKWTPHLITYDYYVTERVSFYQSSFTPIDENGTVIIFGGMLKLGAGAGIESTNDNAFIVDLNSMTGRLVKSREEPGPGHLRLHCAGCIDGCLIIVGGLNAREEQNNQIWKLKVSKLW